MNEMKKMIVNGKVIEDTDFTTKEMYGNKLVPTEAEAKALKTDKFFKVKYWYLKLTDEELFAKFEENKSAFLLAVDRVAFNANKLDEDYVMTFVNHFWYSREDRMAFYDDSMRRSFIRMIFVNYRFKEEKNLKVFAEIFKEKTWFIEPEEECLNSDYYTWEWYGLHCIEEWKEEATVTYEQMDNINKMKELGLI